MSVRELALPARAVTALTRAGITTVDQLAALTRRDLAGIGGLGPGMIAAIRLVVPEPATGTGSGAASRSRRGAVRVDDPQPGSAEEESPAAPRIPSFDSLRAPQRHSAVDLLVPGAARVPPPAPLPLSTPAPATPAPATPAPPTPAPPTPPPPAAPRPAEYADLLRLGCHLVRVVSGVPGQVLRWSVREPVRRVWRLLGQGS